MRPHLSVAALLALLALPALGSRPALAQPASTPPRAAALDLSRYRIVDLTHAFDARTPYWPTATAGFRLDTVSAGRTPGGWHYEAYTLSAPEHGGTHLDAPSHFAESRPSTERVALERLLAPAVVIDVSARAAANADYRLTVADVRAFEARHGRIRPGTIVLLRTGWARRWPDRKAYLGDDTPGDASKLHFPSYGEEAARLLVSERRVAVLGADVASIDYGQSQDFRVHRLAAAADVPGLENLAGLDALPPTGAFVIALPMKIAGGSGGPLRAVALLPR